MNILELPLKRIVMISLLIYSGNHLCAQTECTEMDRETKISNLTKEYGGIPIITFDGKEISLDEYVNMPSGKIGTVLGYGGSVANSYFGEIGKRGVMCLYSQENYRPNFDFDVIDDHTIRPTVFYTCDIPAEFPGGDKMLQKFVIEHCDVPDEFFDINIEGCVHLMCYNDEQGKIHKCRTEKITLSEPASITLNDIHNENTRDVVNAQYYDKAVQMEEYALKVVESLPSFTPAVGFLHNVKYAKTVMIPFSKGIKDRIQNLFLYGAL